jgi:zinc D-Ala-D-Ala carboxypeptidase
MKGSRGVRIVFGVFALAIFAVYSYLRISTSPHTNDFDSENAAIYSDLIAVLNAGGTTEDYYRSDSRFAWMFTDSGDTQTETDENGEDASAEETAATPEPTTDPNSPAAKAAALGLPTPPDIDVSEWQYVLVNGDHSIDQYEPEELGYLNQTADETDIQTTQNGYRCGVDMRIAQALLDMALGCKEAGYPVYLSSGYRSYSDQAANFQRVCANNGVSDGKDANGHYITMPAGCSEHQTGLSCDITDVYHEIKNSEIENTDTYKWLLEHCKEYGFIHRFPSGKEDVTGVMYEPFHFRYVGVEAATYIEDNGLCLEEFLDLYSGTASDSTDTATTETTATEEAA